MLPNPDRTVALTFFPDYRAANPVQALVYDRLAPVIAAQPGGVEAALATLTTRPGPRPVFHLHWEDAVLRPDGASAEAFLDATTRFRAGGGRVIWSVPRSAVCAGLAHFYKDSPVSQEV